MAVYPKTGVLISIVTDLGGKPTEEFVPVWLEGDELEQFSEIRKAVRAASNGVIDKISRRGLAR
ncbi:hypothetical protein SEA_STEPHIG9_39 [Mycobacterium phage Stephig9]|uniref:Uncharacterized protein n=1 Tax=Mycobacterium phage Stephig9 TaxID=2591224 RepID=A0A514DH96_9CAUD|nr:hypothetical protein SEA_STEPHIG9_39 [Mycobacterium phage Stephig9]